MKKVILFADTGIDDAMALIYALRNPDIDLLAVVSGYGNVEREKTYRNVEYLLDLAGRSDIPVISGATRPLNGEDPVFFPDIHGEEGLGPIQPPIPEERYANRSNFSKLFRIIKEDDPNEITIVNVGRCTSLAIAWYLNPEVMADVKQTYVMGGAFLVPGNATAVAEANFYGDAIAANYVCQHVPDLTVIPLNATREALLTPEDVDLIDARTDSPLLDIVEPILDFYYEVYQELEPGIEGTPQHDLAALVATLEIPRMFTYEKREVRVQHEESYANGLSIANFRPGSTDCSGDNCVRIAVDLNRALFANHVIEVLTNQRRRRNHRQRRQKK